MNELISVIVPIYNAEKYLNECLESVINQSYSNLQIILINDDSDDDSEKICLDYLAKDNRVEYLKINHSGIASVRNMGINLAKGKYICMIDSDDFVSNEYVSQMYNAMIKNNASIVVCGFCFFYHNGEKIVLGPHNEGFMQETDVIKSLLSDEQIGHYSCNKLFDRNLFDGISYPEGRVFEDICTTYKLFEKATSVYLIKDCLYYYRQYKKSITKCGNLSYLRQQIEALEGLNIFVNECYPQYSSLARTNLLRFFVVNFNQCSKMSGYSTETRFYYSGVRTYKDYIFKCSVRYKIMGLLILLVPLLYSSCIKWLTDSKWQRVNI